MSNILDTGHPASVEGPEGKLSSRLTNRLGGNDPYRRANRGRAAPPQIIPIAVAANALFQFAVEGRPNDYLIQTGLLDRGNRDRPQEVDRVERVDQEAVGDVAVVTIQQKVVQRGVLGSVEFRDGLERQSFDRRLRLDDGR